MEKTILSLWERIPGQATYQPWLEHYAPEKATTSSSILIIPGSGYRADPLIPKQEGERVANYLCDLGINVFVLRYRVYPDIYPSPLLDGRRAVRYIRQHSECFGIDPNGIAAMGYSAGGHLTASLFAYTAPLEGEGLDEIDSQPFTPDYQILCYPVIGLNTDDYYIHKGSSTGLLGEPYESLKVALSLENTEERITAPTFIWHNFDDSAVNVANSLLYAQRLQKNGASVEMHVFPHGGHGIGLPVDDRKDLVHDKIWIELMVRWLKYCGFWG